MRSTYVNIAKSVSAKLLSLIVQRVVAGCVFVACYVMLSVVGFSSQCGKAWAQEKKDNFYAHSGKISSTPSTDHNTCLYKSPGLHADKYGR